MTVSDLVTQALQDLNIAAAGEVPPVADLQFGLDHLNRILDNWNAERAAVYADQFFTGTLTPTLNPHTIGPSSATFTVTQRPVSIVEAAILQNSGQQQVRIPLRLVDGQQWAEIAAPNIQSELPNWLYYNPTWPNGSLYLWPVPQTAYGLFLQIRVVLAEVALTDDFSLPPGYRDALTCTLAESMAPAFGRQVNPSIVERGRKGRARVWSNNTVVPTLQTQDFGMPRQQSGRRGDFNWRDGRLVGS